MNAPKRILSLVLGLTLAISSLAQSSFFPELERYKLKNGLEVIFADYGQLPVTSLALFVNVGRKNETPGQQGLADLTAGALILGNEKYTQTELDNQLFRLGTQINASANDNFTVISAQFLNKNIDKGVELLSLTLLKPSFPKAEIDEQMRYALALNKPGKMDITQLAGVYSDYFTYSTSHPLGRHFYEEQMKKIGIAQIREFWQFNFTPKNTKLVVTGKPEREKVKQLIEQHFGSWEAAFGEVNGSEYEIAPIKTKEYAFVNKSGVTQACLAWAKRAPAAGSKDVTAFEVANAAFSKRLMDVIREKEGKTYGIGSSYDDAQNNGIYRVRTQVRSEVMYATIESFDRVLKEFYEKGISASELRKMKTMIRAQLTGSEEPASLAAMINPWVYRDYNKRKMYLDELDKLDLATTNKLIKKYFTPDSYKCVIAGDEAALGEQLKKVSNLQRLELKVIEADQ